MTPPNPPPPADDDPLKTLAENLRRIVAASITATAKDKRERRGASDPILDYLRMNASSIAGDVGTKLTEFLARASEKVTVDTWGDVTDSAVPSPSAGASSGLSQQRADALVHALKGMLSYDQDTMSGPEILALERALSVAERLAGNG